MTTAEARAILEIVSDFRRVLRILAHHPEPTPLRAKTLLDLRAQHVRLTAAGGPAAVAQALELLTASIPDA